MPRLSLPQVRLLLLIALVSLIAPWLHAQSVLVNDAGDATHACAVSGTGLCTLRDAILYANATPGTTITFNITGPGVHTISPVTALPVITNPTLIAGYSQPGSATNPSLGFGGRTAAVILIEVDGSVENGSTTGIGLEISGGGTVVEGLVVRGWKTAGIQLETAGNNQVWGSFIGTDQQGTASSGNGIGVRITASSGNIVGGPIDIAHHSGGQYINLISGNGTGIEVFQSPSTEVLQNVVGLNASGNQAIPNGVGIHVVDSSDFALGVQLGFLLSPNTVSGNAGAGVSVQGVLSTGCQISGNYVGAGGTVRIGPIGNGGAGIVLNDAPCVLSRGNTIIGNIGAGIDIVGTSGAQVGVSGFGNTISNNGGAGVLVEGAASGNTITQNSIFGNGGLGIDLGKDGVTANDSCDVDTGPNSLQNFPVLTSATSVGGSTTIQGTLNSAASTTYTIEFYVNDVCDPSGYGQGKTFLNSTMVTTDSSCNATIDVTYPIVTRGIITATATDPNGNTSEFSACRPISSLFHTTTPCRLIDTRGPTGAWGAPALAAGADRTFLVGGKCGVPATALAVVFNFTVTNPTDSGDFRAFAAGSALPLVSTMNWSPGQTRANNAVVTLGPNGDMTIHVDQATGTVDFIADISGYFE
jgi:CSLREA domain-containing protein